MKWNIHESRAALEDKLADKIVEILSQAIEKNGIGKLLVSGGSTPLALFETLSQKALNWDKVTISLVDDRLDPAYSNERMLKERLLIGKASKATYISLVDNEKGTNDPVLVRNNLAVYKDGIDCVILGMGTDKHTASIFPTDEASLDSMKEESPSEIIVYTTAPSVPTKRVSFMPSIIAGAENIILHIHGEVKKELLSEVEKNQNQENTPIGYFVKKGRMEVYYAD